MGHEIKFKIDYVVDFIDKLAPKMAEAGAAAAEPFLKANMEPAIGKSFRVTGKRSGNMQFIPRSTGFLFKSVRVSHSFIDRTDAKFTANVYFDGNRRNGRGVKRNNEIAAYLEYGTPKTPGHNQAPTGFIKKASSQAKRAAESAMVRVYEDYFKTDST